MPFIRVTTNAELSEGSKELIENRLCDAIQIIPGKSDSYLMICVEDMKEMMFHRNRDKNIAMVEVKLFGSCSKSACGDLTEMICEILRDEADVDPSYCYVKFEEVEKWGYNGFMF